MFEDNPLDAGLSPLDVARHCGHPLRREAVTKALQAAILKRDAAASQIQKLQRGKSTREFEQKQHEVLNGFSSKTPTRVMRDQLREQGVPPLDGEHAGALSTIFNQPLIEITITLASSYLAFYTAEALHMSGVLSVVALGLWMGKHGKTRISPEVEHFLSA